MFRIERMELLGFKSFCERTEVAFPDGVTVVVGPNGCGKSNLGDALSWVLGEQSARAVRGDRMEDVIFGGTEGRRALGMAEVTLVLARAGANGNGASPAVHGSVRPARGRKRAPRPGSGNGAEPHGDSLPPGIPVLGPRSVDGEPEAAEASAPTGAGEDLDTPGEALAFREDGRLSVTRRVFRNGDSEYMMNGRRCRLRDIHDVLYGTGLGTRAYSVIEQGKVDTILSGKPRERRLLIEEAAGILGYKARKRAAWLKLEATQANLVRIQDLVGEVSRQIGSLKRQAARARRFRRLQDEARQRARRLFAHRLLETERGRAEGRRALGDLKQREAELAAALGRLAAEADARERLREEMRAALRSADDALSALERRHDQQDGERRQAHEHRQAALAEAAQQEAEAASLHAEAAALGAEAEASGRQGHALDEEAGRTAREATQADAGFRAALAGLQEASARAEQERRSLFEALDRMGRARAQGASLEENLRAGRARLDRLALESAQFRRETEEAGRAQESLAARRAAAQAEAARAQEEARAAAQDRERLEEERAASAREHAALAGRVHGLQEFHSRLERLEAGEQAGSAEEPAPRVADFLEADPEAEAAVEAYVEEWLASRILDPAETSAAAARLQPNGARYWIPRAQPPAPPAAQSALGRLSERVRARGPHAEAMRARLATALLVRDGAQALELAAALPGFDLVALDGTVVSARGEVFRRQRGAPELGLLGRRRLLRQVEEEGAELRRAAREEEARAARLAAQVSQAEERGRGASERAGALTRELASLGAREGEGALARQRLSARQRLLEDEAAALAGDIGLWEREAETAREEIALAEDLTRALEASAASAQDEAERRRQGLEALHAALESSRTRQAEAERRRAVELQKAETLVRRAAEVAARAEALQSQAAASRERARASAGRMQAAEAALKATLEERARAVETRARQERHAEELRAAGEAAHEESRRVERDLQAIRDAAREREVTLARADADWEHLAHECRQDLDLALDQVRPVEGEALPEREACERELAEVREALDGLGPVNLLALEEYQELEKRHEFLTTQQRDLEQSVESLKQTIQRLNRRSREQFIAAFEGIRVHFHELFRLLFGGGRAELKLEEGEDVLECGLEVNVQPPGKRLQSIQLLSGGEKAMAALALLFAIFRHKPSPFCLLDEVDAALDESNVDRFLRVVREFQENTQFVLITHNKRSMEIGDLLYGVTMEEPGVSRLVSVNLA